MRPSAASGDMSSRNTASGRTPSTATAPTWRIASTSSPPAWPWYTRLASKIAVRYDDFSRRQGRADHFVDQLRPGRHVEQHFAAAADRRLGVAVEQNVANPFTQRRAARIAASDDVMPALRNQSQNKSICVDLPTPSMPSKEKNMVACCIDSVVPPNHPPHHTYSPFSWRAGPPGGAAFTGCEHLGLVAVARGSTTRFRAGPDTRDAVDQRSVVLELELLRLVPDHFAHVAGHQRLEADDDLMVGCPGRESTCQAFRRCRSMLKSRGTANRSRRAIPSEAIRLRLNVRTSRVERRAADHVPTVPAEEQVIGAELGGDPLPIR